VIEILAHLVFERGAPEHIRSDDGPEFSAAAIRAWIRLINCSTRFVGELVKQAACPSGVHLVISLTCCVQQ